MSEHTPDVIFDPNYLTASDSDQLYQHCISNLPWRQESIRLFGRTVMQPRLQVWMGDPDARYRYSGTDFIPSPWDPRLSALAKQLSDDFGVPFNSVLCNWYQHGQHSMGWHSDDEPELGKQPVVASVTLGDQRRFILRRRDDHTCRHEYPLGHGHLLVMKGETQALWEHGIPKTRKPVGPRINLTFRQVRQR